MFELALGVSFLERFDGFIVGDAREWRLDFFQLRYVAADGLQVGAATFQAALDYESQKAFGELHEIVERGISHFGLDHPEFSQVTACLRFLGAEGWAE